MDKGELKRRLELARANIDDALALLDTPEQVMLDVPYLSQWGAGADERRGDCGPACVAMLARYYGYGHPAVTVDEAAAACGQPITEPYSNYTGHKQLRDGAGHYGITLRTRSKYAPPSLTLPLLKAQVDDGHPSIVLLHYGVLRDLTDDTGYTENQDRTYSRGHWCLFVGYDDKLVYLHDPDYYGAHVNYGKFRAVPTPAFVSALGAVAPGCTVGNQGLIVV
jgi:hypothetical protein